MTRLKLCRMAMLAFSVLFILLGLIFSRTAMAKIIRPKRLISFLVTGVVIAGPGCWRGTPSIDFYSFTSPDVAR